MQSLQSGRQLKTDFIMILRHEPFSRETLDKLEAEMKKIIKEGHELKRFTLPREEAIKFMQEKNEPYQSRTDRRSSGRMKKSLSMIRENLLIYVQVLI